METPDRTPDETLEDDRHAWEPPQLVEFDLAGDTEGGASTLNYEGTFTRSYS